MTQTPDTGPEAGSVLLSPAELAVVVDAAVQAALAARDAEDQAKIDAANASAQARLDAAAAQAEKKRQADEAERARWEGHTHKWQRADKSGVRTCADCELALPADLVGDARAAVPAGKRA